MISAADNDFVYSSMQTTVLQPGEFRCLNANSRKQGLSIQDESIRWVHARWVFSAGEPAAIRLAQMGIGVLEEGQIGADS